MNAKAHSPEQAVAAEAGRWLARLHASDCTQAERAAFECWRSEAHHAAAYASAEHLWRRVGDLASDPAIAAALVAAQEPVRGAGWRSFQFTPLRLAASFAAVTLLGLVVYRIVETPQIYRTHLGEQRRLTLPDGSNLMLDTATALRVNFNPDRREVALERGRAHFAVAQDPARPFIVRAGGSVITALGTAFDVRNERDEVTVTLVQGKVEVTPPVQAQREILEPGERIRISPRTGLTPTARVDISAASAWTQGNLIFKATALEEAIAEVNRYTARKIRIADADLASMPISGVFHVGDPEAVIVALERSFPIKALRDSDGGGALLTRDPSRVRP